MEALVIIIAAIASIAIIVAVSGREESVPQHAPDYAPPIQHSTRAADPAESAPMSGILLTTAHSLEGYRINRTIEIVTAECAFGMNVFRDMFGAVRDVVGGRSVATQKVLRDARTTCLSELRREAASCGANAVIAVDLDYSEISGGGKSMLFLVASGTAVEVEPAPGTARTTLSSPG